MSQAACNIDGICNSSVRIAGGAEAAGTSSSLSPLFPKFPASGLGPWYSVISYDACVRLCLYSQDLGCKKGPRFFLQNHCAVLRDAFCLHHVLLQPEKELLKKTSPEINSQEEYLKPKKTLGKMKVQVRKVKMAVDQPVGCSFSSLKPQTVKLESLQLRMGNVKSTLSSGWETIRRVRVVPHIPVNSSYLNQSLAYLHAGSRYIKEVSGLLKAGVTSLRKSSSSREAVQETYVCSLRLRSSSVDDTVRMQPGSAETLVFLPDGNGDDLIIEVHDSKGMYCGRVVAQMAVIAEDSGEKLRWWSIYQEPKHELVGRVQLYANYSTSQEENSRLKCGSVAETVAYDLVLEAAIKAQQFQQRKLWLHDEWKWLVMEFASFYGVSDAYTKLRYLSYVMDVATPTADCLSLVYELLEPVVRKTKVKGSLSHQENRMLGDVRDHLEEILALVFENYKSLDESSLSGMADIIKPPTGVAALALNPALELYYLMHDPLTPEAQLKLCRYFQTAAKKRSRRNLLETDEFIKNNNGSTLIDSNTLSLAYQKMKCHCLSVKNEIFTDIKIHDQQVLPSFLELPDLSSSIYSVDLCNRLSEFLVACPPTGPSPPVAELVMAVADFQKDLASWNINPIKGGVDAKELFHPYITRWVHDKRHSLLESCKLDKVNWSSTGTQDSRTPFVDDMYDQLKQTLKEFDFIICRWPDYAFILESAIADVQKAIVETLDKQYADVLAPLKENLSPIKFGLKYVQKMAKGTPCIYDVPKELGILMSSLKRMLDILQPKIEAQLKLWESYMPKNSIKALGERISETTVMLRTKFRNYRQAIVEKLAENTRAQSETKLKKIIQDCKEGVEESNIQNRMQSLKNLLVKTIDDLHSVFETQLFIVICQGLWDSMGQDVLRFLENRKENESWYNSSRVAVSILDETFTSQMRRLLGNALRKKDLELPRSIKELHLILCKDAVNHNDNNYYC
ncbi:hypothetical protein NMG60_11007444 [Bertholletia excelsa]